MIGAAGAPLPDILDLLIQGEADVVSKTRSPDVRSKDMVDD